MLGVIARVTTLITSGAGTSWTLGDGTTADLWGTGLAFTANTTTTAADFKSTFAPKLYTSATNVVITCTGGTFTAGAVELVVFYYNFTALTS